MPFLPQAGRIRKSLLITIFIINYNFCKWQSCFASEFFYSTKSHLYHKTLVTYILMNFLLIKRKLETNLKKTVDEIAQVETSIRNLKDAIWEKDAPHKVAQTRLTNRHQRPNIELCRDEPAHRLVDEVTEIEMTVQQLEKKVRNCNFIHRRHLHLSFFSWRSVKEDREICRVLD